MKEGLRPRARGKDIAIRSRDKMHSESFSNGNTKLSLTVSPKMLLLGPSLRRKHRDALICRADLHLGNQWFSVPFRCRQESSIWGGVKKETYSVQIPQVWYSTAMRLTELWEQLKSFTAWLWSSMAMEQHGCKAALRWDPSLAKQLCPVLVCSTCSCRLWIPTLCFDPTSHHWYFSSNQANTTFNLQCKGKVFSAARGELT